MPLSPETDRQPLFPPALKRLSPNPKKRISFDQELDQLPLESAKFCDFFEGPYLENELCEGSSGHENYHNLNTNLERPAKSTMNGVVNQFSKLHHRKSAMDRMVSTISNLFRRMCHNDGSSVRLLDSCQYQNIDFDLFPHQNIEDSDQKIALIEDEEMEEDERDGLCATTSFKDPELELPNSDAKNWDLIRSKERESNPRRKKWTLSPRKRMYSNTCSENTSIFEEDSDDDGNRFDHFQDFKNTIGSTHRRQKVSPNRSKRYRRIGEYKLPFQNLSQGHKNNLLQRLEDGNRKDESLQLQEDLPTSSSTNLCFGEHDGTSILSVDIEVANTLKTVWTPRCMRKRSSSYDVMYLAEDSEFSHEMKPWKKGQDPGSLIRRCSSALDQSNTAKYNLVYHDLFPRMIKSDSVLVGDFQSDPCGLNLVTCGHLTESTGDLVSDLSRSCNLSTSCL